MLLGYCLHCGASVYRNPHYPEWQVQPAVVMTCACGSGYRSVEEQQQVNQTIRWLWPLMLTLLIIGVVSLSYWLGKIR